MRIRDLGWNKHSGSTTLFFYVSYVNHLIFHVTLIFQVESNFVYLFPVLNTDDVPLHLKPYLPLLLELLMESPILEDDGTTLVPYEEVVAQLATDFLVTKAGLGLKSQRFLAGSYGQAAVLELQTVPGRYATGSFADP
jgi:hypothetical protein